MNKFASDVFYRKPRFTWGMLGLAMLFTLNIETYGQPAVQNWTGTGGKGMSITILSPRASGLAENQNHLPALIQGELVSNFSNYSAISVLEWEEREALLVRLLSEAYSDSVSAAAAQEVGNAIPTTHFMQERIMKTPDGYNLQIRIVQTSDKATVASFSENFTYWDLNNLTAIRRASLDLLPKMGVTLTAKARQELTGAATENHVNAQNALARGVTAQRQGTEVAALSYYFQAATFDPSLREAVNRSSILNTNITSGNIGADVRNDIQWRKQWVDRLAETERFFDNFNKMESMPYTLFYTNDIKQGEINYQTESVAMSIETYLYSSGIWALSIERALQAVWDGLNATGRKDTWQLGSWPQRGVTELKAFERRNKAFAVAFELLNNQNKVIGRQTLQSSGSWGLNWHGRPVVEISSPDRKALHFQNVNANDITDRMSIRVASVNGAEAESAAIDGVLQIRVITEADATMNDRFRLVNGEIQRFNNSDNIARLVIPNTIWGAPVSSIGPDAFRSARLSEIIIHNGIISIGENAFRDNQLIAIDIPSGITTIGEGAFWENNNLESITIGANVAMGPNSFGGGGFHAFPDNYNQNGKLAGTYHKSMFRFVNGEIQGFADNAVKVRDFVIPDIIWGNQVTSIGKEAFKGVGSMSITIPNSVRSIGAFAFGSTSRVTIGADVKLGEFAIFYSEHVSLQSGASGIANYQFGCSYGNFGKTAGTYVFKKPSLFGGYYPDDKGGFVPSNCHCWDIVSGERATEAKKEFDKRKRNQFWFGVKAVAVIVGATALIVLLRGPAEE